MMSLKYAAEYFEFTLIAPTAPYWYSSPKTTTCFARRIREIDSAIETWDASSITRRSIRFSSIGKCLDIMSGSAIIPDTFSRSILACLVVSLFPPAKDALILAISPRKLLRFFIRRSFLCSTCFCLSLLKASRSSLLNESTVFLESA